MARRALTVGVAQMQETARLGRNLQEIAQFAELGRRDRADLVVFPECALTGYGPAYHGSKRAFDPDAVDAGVAEVRELARRTGVALLVGAHLPFESGWTNSAFLVGANGRILTRYDKAHLYGDDAKYYLAGRARPQSAAVKGALVASVVCFDFRFPEPFRRLALDGAQAIAVPSHVHGRNDMWKGPVVEGHIRSRAAENGRYVIFANAAGAPQNVPSMIADPRGEVVVMARRGPRAFLTATLDLTRVNDDFLSCRRTDLYGK